MEIDLKKKIFTSSTLSPMRFMEELFLFDKNSNDSYVRFRGPFIMPDWKGVEENEQTFLVEGGIERLDKIAAAVWGLGYMELWWVIAARNGIDLPSVQLYAGQILKIPYIGWVETKLLTQANKLTGR